MLPYYTTIFKNRFADFDPAQNTQVECGFSNTSITVRNLKLEGVTGLCKNYSAPTTTTEKLFESHIFRLDLRVVELRLKFLYLCDLPRPFHEVFLENIVAVIANGEETGLRADVAEVGSIETIGEFHNALVVDVSTLCDGRSVNLQNLKAGSLIRQGYLDFSIQSTRTKERRIEDVRTVGRHYNFYSSQTFKAYDRNQMMQSQEL